jgi:hypothetical protein
MSVIDGQCAATAPVPVVSTSGRTSSARTIAAWVLVVLSCVLVVLGTVAVGIQQLLLNTDRWVAVVGPLARDPDVQSSMADTASRLTLNALDLQGRTQALPTPVRGLAAPIEAAIGSFVDDQSLHLMQSPEFSVLWEDLNRSVHRGLVQLLRGDTTDNGAVNVSNGEVQLDLLSLAPALMRRLDEFAPEVLAAPLPASLTDASMSSADVRQRLTEVVGHQLPADFGYVPVASAASLVTLRQAVQLLDRASWGLILAAVVAVAVTLVVSLDRRLTLFRLGVGITLGMLLVGAALIVVDNRLLSSLGGRPISGAVQAALGAVLASIGQYLLVVAVLAAGVALIAYLAGRDWSRRAMVTGPAR